MFRVRIDSPESLSIGRLLIV